MNIVSDWTDDELDTVRAAARTVWEDAAARYFELEDEYRRRHPPEYPTCRFCGSRTIGGQCDTPGCPCWHGCPF